MGSRETEQLRQNINDQLDRLVQQLADLEEYKTDLEADEYEQMKGDTKEQMQEFSQSLVKISSGDITLVDQLSAVRLALQAAISDAFKTPEIIRMFAKKQPAMLRLKLEELERDRKIQKITEHLYYERKVEILTALQKLGDKLTPDEENFLSEQSSDILVKFQTASNDIGSEELFTIVEKNIQR